jgi:4-hydroxybenzoate polyprenyltransferase
MDESAPAVSIGKITKLFDYIFFLRPILHPPVWTIVILGFFRVPTSNANSDLIYLLLLSSTAASWAYIVNQISDIESDRINNKLHFLPRGLISLKAAYIMAGLALIITVVGALLMAPIIGILFTIGLIFGYIYSGKPFYGKNRPIVSVLSNGIAHGILPFLAGYIGAGGRWQAGAVFSLPYFFAVAAVFIGTTIPDIPGDLKSGKITLGVALGVRVSTVIMTFYLAIALLLSLMVKDTFLIVVAGVSLPFYIAAIIVPTERRILIAIKLSILLLSVAACIEFWPYALILIGLFVITRFYYRKRFGAVYPSLT